MQEAVFLNFSIQESSLTYACSSIMAQMDNSCKKEQPAHTPCRQAAWSYALAAGGVITGEIGAVIFFAGIKARIMTAIARTR